VLVGVVAAIIVLILSLLALGTLYAANVLVAIITVLIFAIIIGGIMGTICGIIGVLIKGKS
jgi:hypothetical protein